MRWVLVGIGVIAVVAVVAIMGIIRLAPSDQRVWNVPIADRVEANPGPCADQIRVLMNGARSACILPGQPVDVLTRLGVIAEAYPRTVLLAGTPAEGRVTWIARSRVMGYPDYITAEVVAVPEGTRLDLHARQRFGSSDHGVNGARLKLWLGQM